jgi:SAM-dependent methyltransferase
MTQPEHHHDHGHQGDGPGGDDLFSEAAWDKRYRACAALWSGHPNPQLLAEASGLPAGRALDAGCGEGADAIWLAERGWVVTAVDISTVALDRGAAHASQLGTELAERITWQQADLFTWEPQPQSYDLVSAQFMQLPADKRTALFDRLGAGVATGGTLLIVGHSPADLNTTVARPPAELFFTAAQVASALDPSLWTVQASEARLRDAHDPDGHPVTVYDEVVAARRK